MKKYYSGSQQRTINRKGNCYEVAQSALSEVKTEEELQPWLKHNNARVRLLAFSYAVKLHKASLQDQKSVFDLLVERFTKEGKKDPIKSARASLAASARKLQKEVNETTVTQYV